MKIKWVKAGTLMFLAAYLVFLCTRGWAKDVPIEEIASKMEQDKTITSLEKCGARQLRRFYGLEAGNLEGYVFYKAESPMSVDEFLVVKAEVRRRQRMCWTVRKSIWRSRRKVLRDTACPRRRFLQRQRWNRGEVMCCTHPEVMRSSGGKNFWN